MYISFEILLEREVENSSVIPMTWIFGICRTVNGTVHVAETQDAVIE